jgi:hypothetical protein
MAGFLVYNVVGIIEATTVIIFLLTTWLNKYSCIT